MAPFHDITHTIYVVAHSVVSFFDDLRTAPGIEKGGLALSQGGGASIMGTALVIDTWNEVALIVGMLVGFAGLLIQYRSYKSRQRHEDRIIEIRIAEAKAKGADVSMVERNG